MNASVERRLVAWLDDRDPGSTPPRLRAAIAAVPYSVKPNGWPVLDRAMTRVLGPWTPARAALVGVLLLAAVVAFVGAAILRPWDPFPPRGLIAYTVPLPETGSTGIELVAADGNGKRQVSPAEANRYDHSPRWSADGRTLLFARTTQLDPIASCGGVGSVVLYDVASGAERVVASGLRPMNVVEWSPSGDRAAYTYPPPGCGADVELGIVDLRTGAVTTTEVLPSPSQGPVPVLWHVEWAGDVPSAVPDATTVTTNGRDFTTSTDVPSHDRRALIRYSYTTPERIPELVAIDGATGASIDLGPGGLPAWSPDDTAIAYVQPGGPGGPDAVNYRRGHLVIVPVESWQPRLLVDVLVIDAPPAEVLPALSWTSDGAAIYWFDDKGVHVVDVDSGRSAVLTAIPDTCADVQWQPVSE